MFLARSAQPVAPRGLERGAFRAKAQSSNRSTVGAVTDLSFRISVKVISFSYIVFFGGPPFYVKYPRRLDSPLSFKFSPGRFEPMTFRGEVRRSTTQPMGQLLIYGSSSPIFQFSDFPIFQFSDFPISQFPNFPIFQFSNFPISQYSDIPISQYSDRGQKGAVGVKGGGVTARPI